jgi:hypothetical protein
LQWAQLPDEQPEQPLPEPPSPPLSPPESPAPALPLNVAKRDMARLDSHPPQLGQVAGASASEKRRSRSNFVRQPAHWYS